MRISLSSRSGRSFGQVPPWELSLDFLRERLTPYLLGQELLSHFTCIVTCKENVITDRDEFKVTVVLIGLHNSRVANGRKEAYFTG